MLGHDSLEEQFGLGFDHIVPMNVFEHWIVPLPPNLYLERLCDGIGCVRPKVGYDQPIVVIHVVTEHTTVSLSRLHSSA